MQMDKHHKLKHTISVVAVVNIFSSPPVEEASKNSYGD